MSGYQPKKAKKVKAAAVRPYRGGQHVAAVVQGEETGLLGRVGIGWVRAAPRPLSSPRARDRTTMRTARLALR